MKYKKEHNIEHDPEEAALVIEAFYDACRSGEGGLKSVPGLLLRIINEGLWRKRRIKQTKEIVEFDKFEDFITGMPPEGLGENPEILKKLCRDNDEAIEALQREFGKEIVPTALEQVLRLLPKLSKEEIKEVQSKISEMV